MENGKQNSIAAGVVFVVKEKARDSRHAHVRLMDLLNESGGIEEQSIGQSKGGVRAMNTTKKYRQNLDIYSNKNR